MVLSVSRTLPSAWLEWREQTSEQLATARRGVSFMINRELAAADDGDVFTELLEACIAGTAGLSLRAVGKARTRGLRSLPLSPRQQQLMASATAMRSGGQRKAFTARCSGRCIQRALRPPLHPFQRRRAKRSMSGLQHYRHTARDAGGRCCVSRQPRACGRVRVGRALADREACNDRAVQSSHQPRACNHLPQLACGCRGGACRYIRHGAWRTLLTQPSAFKGLA